MNRICTLCLLLILAMPALAQPLVKQADRQFDQLAYTKATELYELALRTPKSMTEGELRATRAKLAYSYRQMRDMPNAEKVYRALIGAGDLPDEYVQNYLYYAQVLASNGKYSEAQEAYEKYNASQNGDPRGAAFTKLYRDVSSLSKNAGSYKVNYLTVNTRKPEFSPMYYKNGLVFVSSDKKGGGRRRVFTWDNSPFLDLFYTPQIKALRDNNPASLGTSTGKKQPVVREKVARVLGQDEYTASTANDSRTVGFYGGNNPAAGLGYDEKPLTESEPFSRTLNSKYHEGPATFTRDGSRVIFTRNNFNDSKYREGSDGISKLKLYSATQINGDWGDIEELPFNSNDFSTGHPALSKDDKLLYFASDMPGGLGGTDIYVSRWVGKTWGKPVNLGKTVNSTGNEMFPYVDAKGNLYYSSDGQAGLGGLDIFFAELTDRGDAAKKSLNLGEPINSGKDDFGLITDGERKMGYFSSNRKNGGTDDDLYRFLRDGPLYPCRELIVSVLDALTKQPLGNTVIDLENKDVSGSKKQVQTDTTGTIRLCLDAENDFNFLASRTGYADSRLGFSTKGLNDDQPSRLEFSLDRSGVLANSPNRLRGRVTTQKDKQPIEGVTVVLVNGCDGSRQETTTGPDGRYEFTTVPGCDYVLEAMKDDLGTTGGRMSKDGVGSTDITMFRKGDVITIDNIYYDLNKADIRADAAAELDKLADLMTKYPTMKIEMRSHTDSRATAQYNKTLSANRAKAAVAYLKAKGVSAKRLKATGYGETALVNKCQDGVDCPDEDHQQNRRTEIKILTVN
ncbi:MAG: OmpA family protein [Bacteroidetes bacterium]|nr:OmpA family protein [Fibrella sp.]